MKPASTFVVFALLLCAIVLFVSAARDNPKGDKEIGAELARGRCVKGCCSRSIIGRCKVCCASDEEAKAAAKLNDGMGVRGSGDHVDEEAKVFHQSTEAKP